MTISPVHKNIATPLAIAIALLSFALTGCMLGPDNATPSLSQMPGTFLNGTLAGGSAENLSSKWWESFNDTILIQLLKDGDTANLSLLQSVQRIELSRAALSQTSASLWPSLDGSAAAPHTKTWNPDTSKSVYNAGLDAVWQLDLFGGNRRNTEAAEADLEAAGYSLADARLSIAGEIATAYFNLRLLQSNLDIAQSNLAIQVESAQIARDKAASGFTSGLDALASEAQIQNTQAEIPSIEAAITSQCYAIELLLGRYPGDLSTLLSPHASIPLTAALPASAPSELLKRRADIRKAEADLHAATARIGAAEADRFPSIQIGGFASLTASSLTSWSDAVQSAGITPSISLPLFSGGLLKARVQERKAAAEASLLAYTETVLTAFSEVETAWAIIEREQARDAALQLSLQYNQESLDIATELYQVGESDYLEVLIYQKSTLSAQQAIAQHRATLAQQSVKLFKALGGPVAQ